MPFLNPHPKVTPMLSHKSPEIYHPLAKSKHYIYQGTIPRDARNTASTQPPIANLLRV